jgi:MFS transporter, DHA1 family, tetracycline resistance protein
LKNKFFIKAAPLFFVIAIDSMGLGILFPILSSMIIDVHSQFLPAATSLFNRELLYGMIIGIYMLCWFFGAAMLGDLSDIVGRKKSLLVCLLGAVVGYVLSGVAIELHSIVLLIAGRVIAGFTAGSQPIAQAAVVDLSTEETKARNIGYILLAVSLGFVLGPLLGGVLSDSNIVGWFGFAVPMYCAAILSAFNALLLWFTFSETFVVTRKFRIRIYYAIQIFIEAFRHKKLCWLSLVLLIFISGWGEYFGFISQFLLRRYHYSILEVSMFMVTLSVGFSIGFGVLVDFFTNRFKLKYCALAGLLVSSILSLITVITFIPIIAWIASVFVGMGVAVAYSALITLFSNQVDDSEQGWVMGVTNSIMALSFGITTFFSGFAANFYAGLPLLWTFAGLLLASVVLWFVRV